MGAAASITTTLSELMQTYYDKLFIETAKHWLVFEEGAQKRPLPDGEGKAVSFQRYTALNLITAALSSEGGNPSAVALSATNVTASVSEYGSYTSISKLLSLTAIDPRMKGAVQVMAQNMGESIDQLVRNELENGTAQLAGAKSLISDVAASDVLSYVEISRAVKALKLAKALRYPDNYFIGKVNPYTSFDMMKDSTWLAAKEYSDVQDLYRGEIGRIGGVRFLESTNPKSTSSTVTVYHNYIHGAEAFGITELAGDTRKIYVKTPGPSSTDNPLDRFSTVGWAISFVPKVLDTTWIRVVKTAATA